MIRTFEAITSQEIQLAAVGNAMELSLGVTADDPTNHDLYNVMRWLYDVSDVGYTRIDPNNLRNTLVVRPGMEKGHQTIVFVEEGDAAARSHPHLRVSPQYDRELETMFMPIEAAAHPTLLAGLLMFGAIHAVSAKNPNIKKAIRVFPEIRTDNAVDLLTDISAYQFEGKLLTVLMGDEFGKYMQAEINLADGAAIISQVENNVLDISVGLNVDVIERHMLKDLSITDDSAKEFMMDMLKTTLPAYGAMRTLDQILARSPGVLSEDDTLIYKAGLLPGFSAQQ